MLFYRIEQCQEIQTLAQDPCLATLFINNAVSFLMQSHIFPIKEFDTWDAITPKTYPALKTFIHEAYTRRLTAVQLRSTAGQLGYGPTDPTNNNMYTILGDDDDTFSMETVATQVTTIKQTAAMTKSGTLGSTYAATTVPSEIAAALSQLAANQTAIMNQMVAMSVNPPPTHQATFIPPMQPINVPWQQPYTGQATSGYNPALGYYQGGGYNAEG
jgi:hypothetical protein